MPELRPSEYVQRGAVVLGRVMRTFAENYPLMGRPWPEMYERRDATNGVSGRLYSLDDPRFLLRVLTEHRTQFGEFVTRAQSNYAHELRETLNRAAHEPQNITLDDAERALSTMRLLIKPWQAGDAADDLTALLRQLRTTAPEPVPAATVDPGTDDVTEELSTDPSPDEVGFTPVQDDPEVGDPADDDDLESGLRRVTLACGQVTVSVIVREAVSLALVENEVSPIVDLVVDNAGDAPAVVTDVTVTLGGADGDYAEPRTFPDFRVPAGGREDVGASQLRWPLRRDAFAHLDEARSASVEVGAIIDGTLRRGSVPIRLLARDEWTARSIPELLAAFVTPNAAGVAELLDQTAELLAATTGDPSLQGYQDGRERAVEIGRAAYEAIRARQIRYGTPPASFEDDGQKVRGVARVLEERFGTCLDFVLVYCSLLEQAGLNPVVVHVPGHAYAGFLTEENQLSDVALEDRALVHNLVNSQLFVGVEMTLAADGRSRGFDEAVAATAQWRTEDVDGDPSRTIGHLLDVRAAHRRIRPLARMNASGDVIEIEVDAAPASPYRIRRPGAETTLPPEPVRPRRVENWRSALLDLSLRNPLLKLKSTSGVVVATTEASLPSLEDLVAGGATVELRAGDAVDAIHLAQGKRTARQLDDASLEGILRSENAVYLDTTRAKHEGALDRLRRRRKTVIEETGASSLFLTLGALSWKDAKGSTALAPLFLLPVTVDGRKGRRYSLQAEPGAQVQPNYCLQEKLRRDFGVEIPVLANPPADDSGIDLQAVFERVREELLSHSLSFSVEPHCRIALLQFSTLEMWRDLSENWEQFLANPVVKHLVETPTDAFEDTVPEPDIVPEDEVRARLPLPVDGSQLKAVRWATSGRTFVLQGPPGTGKSQTIANVIADCLAEGRQVLFVAEKQAALDVVRTRLDKVGLGPLCLDVHGRDQSIKAVRAQLDASISTEPTTWPASYEVTRQHVEGAIEGLDRYARRLHEPGAAGESVWSARQQMLAQPVDPGENGVAFHVPGAVVTGRLRLGEVYAGMRRLSEAMRQLGATDDVADWALVGSEGEDDPAVLAPVFDRLAAASGRLDPTVVNLLAALDVQDWAGLQPWLAHVDDRSAVAPTVVDALGGRRALDELASLDRDLDHFHTRFGPFLQTLSPQSEDIDTAKVRADIAAAEERGFFARKRARASVLDGVRARLAATATPTYEGLPDLLDMLDRFRENDRELRERLARLLPGAATPYDLDLRPRLGRFADRVGETLDLLERHPRVVAAVDAVVTSTGRRSNAADLAEYRAAWSATCAAFGASSSGIESWAAGRSLPEAVNASLPTWRGHVERGRVARIQRIRRVATELGRLEAAGFTDLAEKLGDGTIPPEGLEARVRRRITAVVLAERLETTGLDTYDAVRHEQRVDTYRTGVRQIRRQLVDVLPSTMLRRRQAALASMGGLKREIGRKRGGTIRELFRVHGRDVLTVTPCLLMSPHSVAKNLPLGSVDVDVVIFDEASQIRVAEAVGAMGRAQSVIVVGDSRQMPPTSMFATSLDADDDDVETGEEGALAALAPADQESILSEAVDSNIPSLWLTWHYRSQAEELIAFSNTQYYQGKLSSFPAPPGDRPGLGVRMRRVDGHYDRGATRTNQVEADAIMTEIVARLHADPDASIGVVTFNVQQRTLIEDLLDASTDPVVRSALAREEDALFVKNLENVQGDERDVILFSLAFSPDPETGRLRLNFGPLTAAGGERRLNVAITRARREIVLFSSFDPRAIDLSRTGSEGMRHLREYLLFAESVEKDLQGSAVVDHDLQRADIAVRLAAAGLEVVENIGMSTFRVDLGVRLPGREWIAVLLDSPRWAARPTVADRDDIPDTMLTGHMGWSATTTIWTPAWIAEPDACARSVLATASSAPVADEAPLPVGPSPVSPVRMTPESEPMTPEQQTPELGRAASGSQQPAPWRVRPVPGPEQPTPQPQQATPLVTREPASAEPEVAPSPTVDDAAVREMRESDVARESNEAAAARNQVPEGRTGVVHENSSTPDIALAEPRPHAAPRVARRQPHPPADPPRATPVGPGSRAWRGGPSHRSMVPFEAADASARHSIDILDQLGRTENKAILREELLDILDTEAPIQVDRFMRIAGGRFGLNRTHKVRAEQILRFLPSDYELRGRGDGLFCWPTNVTAQEYPYVRTSHGAREIEEIPPEEIENAVRIALDGFTLREEQRVLRDVMGYFGFARMGGIIRAALTAGVLRLESRGVVRRQDDMIGLVRPRSPAT